MWVYIEIEKTLYYSMVFSTHETGRDTRFLNLNYFVFRRGRGQPRRDRARARHGRAGGVRQRQLRGERAPTISKSIGVQSRKTGYGFIIYRAEDYILIEKTLYFYFANML